MRCSRCHATLDDRYPPAEDLEGRPVCPRCHRDEGLYAGDRERDTPPDLRIVRRCEDV